ncbi:MAG: ATP-binding cassette domain-containing protein [Clostridia bacterium]|jgi:polar amino acid transport system ATP-binding protein|nr:ATP-binding cassette domain-containing protein [Clostridia bacterium]MDD4275659.1 ATP-binding cassette domain-containing protein [Clostridia bacterium]
MITTDKVFLKFNSNFYTLYDINLEILTGEKVVILGESESGKSTLLKVLVGLIKPTSGNVCVNGTVLNGVIKNTPTLFIPESSVFFNNATAFKNLKWAIKQLSSTKQFDIIQILQEYGILELKDIKVKLLSEYQKFLLSVARGMLKSPEIVVIDDTIKKFNEKEINEVVELLQKIAKNKDITMIIATSNLEFAKKLGYKTIKINLGSIQN